MKGVIFTEFADMVEEKFGPDMLDHIIDQSDLPSGGSYTAVGTYDHAEMVTLVVALSAETGIPAKDLILVYCDHLFKRFTVLYPAFFENEKNVFDFMKCVDAYIHVEVKKLYPDAELPRIECKDHSDSKLEVVYHSSRHLGDVAEGLIRGCVNHFGESIEIERNDHTNGDDAQVQFFLKKAA